MNHQAVFGPIDKMEKFKTVKLVAFLFLLSVYFFLIYVGSDVKKPMCFGAVKFWIQACGIQFPPDYQDTISWNVWYELNWKWLKKIVEVWTWISFQKHCEKLLTALKTSLVICMWISSESNLDPYGSCKSTGCSVWFPSKGNKKVAT